MKTISGSQYSYAGVIDDWYVFVNVRSGDDDEIQLLKSVRLEVAPHVYAYFNPIVDGKANVKQPPFAVPNRYEPERSCYSRMKAYYERIAALTRFKG